MTAPDPRECPICWRVYCDHSPAERGQRLDELVGPRTRPVPGGGSALLELLRPHVRRGEFTLSSGMVSDLYVDCRAVTLTPRGSRLVGERVASACRMLDLNAVAGPVSGACPIVTAAGIVAASRSLDLRLAYVRSGARGHGLARRVEGPSLDPDCRVLLVDDVLTTGGSLIRATVNLIDFHGVEICHALVIVDRGEGGREALAEVGITTHALFTREDLLGD